MPLAHQPSRLIVVQASSLHFYSTLQAYYLTLQVLNDAGWKPALQKPMNILFLLPQIPYPPHSGGRIVTWNTVKRFAKTNSVSVVCLYHHPTELEALDRVRECCDEVAAFPAHGKWSIPTFVKSLVGSWPYKARRFFNPDMALYIHRLIERKRFDAIHCQNFYTAAYCPTHGDFLKIHYKENVEGNILLRYSTFSRNPIIKIAAWLEGHRTRRYELDACKRFDHVLSISPIDRDTLTSLAPALSVTHQRPGVDLPSYPFLDEPEGPTSLLFTGSMSYYPNSTGVLDFLEASWPSVRERLPDCGCTIVGADPPDALRQWDGRDGVRVTGRVERVDTYLQDGLIYIVPLRIGGGIRLKILEAMASGRAIVSTPVGCEGLEGKHGEHLLIADDPIAFADAIVELIRDREKRTRISRNARELVETVYDWDKVIDRQAAMLQSLLRREETTVEQQKSDS